MLVRLLKKEISVRYRDDYQQALLTYFVQVSLMLNNYRAERHFQTKMPKASYHMT